MTDRILVPDIMGKVVTVNKVLLRRYQANKRSWVAHDYTLAQRAGWVTGYRVAYDGYIAFPLDATEWIQTKATRCILVCYWPTYNPVRVPLDGFVLGGTPRPSTLRWTKHDRAALREAMKSVPRDAHGQWKATICG